MSFYCRKVEHHKAPGLNEAIDIDCDERDPNAGHGSHHYCLSWTEADESGCDIEIPFQHGPVAEVGVNGVTIEALLAVCADRLEGFQSGPFACDENESALQQILGALRALQSRTRDRQARGVEGTNKV